ncbi:hypothetical protein SVAN01_00080 [Stagonosporopsis vannaccii]|nr:hypothetical protein SVAN01_00080 [Stagonosporopsis vannaccii]
MRGKACGCATLTGRECVARVPAAQRTGGGELGQKRERGWSGEGRCTRGPGRYMVRYGAVWCGMVWCDKLGHQCPVWVAGAGSELLELGGYSRCRDAAARGSLWASRPVTSHTDEGCALLGHIDCNALWGPYPSATLSCRCLAGIGPSARHLPLLGRSVACQEKAHPGRKSARCTNANSARHANAGGQLAIALAHLLVHLLDEQHARDSQPAQRSWSSTNKAAVLSVVWLGCRKHPSSDRKHPCGTRQRIWKSNLGPCLSGHAYSAWVLNTDAGERKLQRAREASSTIQVKRSANNECYDLQLRTAPGHERVVSLKIPHTQRAGAEGRGQGCAASCQLCQGSCTSSTLSRQQ